MKVRLGEVGRLLRTLGNERRLRLVHALWRGELCVCELVDTLRRPQYEVSRDLAALRKLGLVEDRHEGSWVYYSIPAPVREDAFLGSLLRLIEGQRLALRAGERRIVGIPGQGAAGMKESAMVTIEIFDPPMCCPTGVCGPRIDPALMEVQEVVRKVRSEFDAEVHLDRYLLGQQSARFMKQPEVLARLRAKGLEALPITVVDGAAVKEAGYPTYAELRGWIERARATAPGPTGPASNLADVHVG